MRALLVLLSLAFAANPNYTFSNTIGWDSVKDYQQGKLQPGVAVEAFANKHTMAMVIITTFPVKIPLQALMENLIEEATPHGIVPTSMPKESEVVSGGTSLEFTGDNVVMEFIIVDGPHGTILIHCIAKPGKIGIGSAHRLLSSLKVSK